MKFVDPDFLLALLVLLIPLIIHFFNFKRYKTVFFSQVGFLKAIQQDTRKKSELKKFLILLSRLFMLAALVLAFCQPYIPIHKSQTLKNNQSVAIYLDNSFSMMGESTNGPMLEEAKAKAIAIANAFAPGTLFLLLTNDPRLTDQIPISREQLIERLSKIKESPKALTVGEVYQLLKNGLESAGDNSEKNIYLLSDFQSHLFDIEPLKEDTLSRIFLVQFTQAAINNLLIDSCWFETPARLSGGQEKLFVSLLNQSEQTIQNQPLRLMINDSLKALSTINMEAGGSQVAELNFKNNNSGFQQGIIELDDFPVIYDNTFYFSYQVNTNVSCLLVYNPNEEGIHNFEALFANDPFFKLEKIENKKFQADKLTKTDFVILLNLNEISSGMAKSLSSFIHDGGTLCVFPGQSINKTAYNSFYQQVQGNQVLALNSSPLSMNEINGNHLVFKAVFQQIDQKFRFPEIKLSYRYSNFPSSDQNVLIRFVNGSPAITETPFGRGRFYNFNFPLTAQNAHFLRDPLFVPLIYNMALNSNKQEPIHFNIGKLMFTEVVKGQREILPPEIRRTGSSERFRVPVLNETMNHRRLDLSHLIHRAGFYDLIADKKIIKKLAFNYKRAESKNKSLSADEINAQIKEGKLENVVLIESSSFNFSEQIKEITQGIEWWYFFVILALIFLLTETAIIRWMK